MEILFEEMIVDATSGRSVPIVIRQLRREELPAIEEVQQKVVDALQDRSVLQPLTTEEFRFLLDGNGLIVGAFADGRLAGFRGLLVPPVDDQHLGLDFGLSVEELPQVVYQEVSAVLPEWRGHRLQQKMAAAAMQQLPELGRAFRYICSTVAPMNIPSMKDKFYQGMEIRALKEKYGGSLRYIFVKDITKQPAGCAEPVLLPADDFRGQEKILVEGFVGTALREKDDRQLLEFCPSER